MEKSDACAIALNITNIQDLSTLAILPRAKKLVFMEVWTTRVLVFFMLASDC